MLPLFELRKLFYAVSPSEICIENFDGLAILSSESAGAVLISLEIFVSLTIFHNAARAYDISDSMSGIFGVIASELERSLLGFSFFYVYGWLHERVALVGAGDACSLPMFAAGVVLIDFARYWAHRLEHEVALLWAVHKLHHSSEYFNLFAGLRMFGYGEFLLSTLALPMAFVIPTEQFAVHFTFINLVGFWQHTFVIGKMPRFFEAVFVTPSQHRVHHGRNPYAIDKNYGTIFVVWDKLFGTFQPEATDEALVYGTIEPTMTYNQLRLYFDAQTIWDKFSRMPTLKLKVQSLVCGPGWEPGTPRLGDPAAVPRISERTSGVRLRIKRSPVEHLCMGVKLFVVFLLVKSVIHRSDGATFSEHLLGYSACLLSLFSTGEALDGLIDIFKLSFLLDILLQSLNIFSANSGILLASVTSSLMLSYFAQRNSKCVDTL